MRHFPEEKNSKISSVSSKKIVLRFLSLSYSADFGRSRLVSKTSELTVFFQHISISFCTVTATWPRG